METIREAGQFSLNYEPLQGLYNVTNSILLKYTKDKGVSYWFDEETKDVLTRCSDHEFISRCKQMAGNDIYSKEVARAMWQEFGDIPVNDSEEIEQDWKPVLGGHFFEGDSREDVWHWFERTFKVSVAEDLMFTKVTKDRWNNMDYDQREAALLSAISDINDVQRFGVRQFWDLIDKNYDDLNSEITSNMYK